MWWLRVLLLTVAAAVAAAAAPPVGLPGCPTSCGNVTVPYPFGIGTDCALSPGFSLSCDDRVWYNSPRLFLGDATEDDDDRVQVTDISLVDATVRVISKAILNTTSFENGTVYYLDLEWPPRPSFLGGNRSAGSDHGGRLVLSFARNKFFVIGCMFQATLHWRRRRRGDELLTGCSSFCSLSRQVKGWAPAEAGTGAGGCHNYTCDGNGCCMATIPRFSTSYAIHVVRMMDLDEESAVVDPMIQNLVIIGEVEWMNHVWCRMIGGTQQFLHGPHGALPDLSEVPVVLEWAMNSTASKHNNTARCPTDTARSACLSKHSSCKEVRNPFIHGYMCRCLPGYQGNPYLTDGCQDVNECNNPEQNGCYGECTNMPGTFQCRCRRGFQGNAYIMHGCVKSSQGLSIGIGVGSGATVLILTLSTTIIIRKLKERRTQKQRQRFFEQNRGKLLQQLVCQRADIAERMIITEEELQKATNNFDKSRELGGGGHGTVYKGILSSQHVVAIKKSKIMIQKEINDFINEVAILSQVNHRNIVKLIGCCLETKVPLLVYEFICNGTLYSHLHVEASVSLSWKDRLRVAVEIARALTYLHSLASIPIIHRDIKSLNILLDDMLTVKLSDFGASRYIRIDEEGLHTTVQGTLGYLDPVYHITGHLTEKSDVYSFGVLLIELLTRKKPDSYRSPQGLSLVYHFGSLLSQHNLDEILDPQVAREGDGEVVDIALLAQMCVKFSSVDRPTMRQVGTMLESIQEAKDFCSDVTDDGKSSEGASLVARS